MYRSIEDLFDEFKESLNDLTMKNANFAYQNSQNGRTTDEEDGDDDDEVVIADEENDQNADDELDREDEERMMIKNEISAQRYGWRSERRLDDNLNQGGEDLGSSKVFQSCRLMRQYLHEIREKSLRALAFSKLLQKDLEIACKLALKCSKTEILSKLFHTNHCLIKTVNFTPEFLIFCNESVTQNEQYLQTLLNVTCGQDERLFSPNLPNKMGYLILVDCDQTDEGSKEHLSSKWMGNVRTIKPNADTNLALHNLEVDGIYFVAISSEKLIEQRSMIKKLIGSELVSFLSEQCSCHGMISEYMHELKTCALNMSSKIIWWLNLMEEHANLESDLKNDENRKHYRDVLIQAYNFAFEYHRDLYKILSGELKLNLLKMGVRKLVEKWVHLIGSICDRGRGSRPRWADEGLNFLVFASDPIYTLTLETKQFQDFKNILNKCIEHIVGSNSPPGSARKKDRHEAAISSVTVVTEPPVHRAISWPQDKNLSSMASIARKCSVHTVKDVVDPNLDQETASSSLHNFPHLKEVTNLNLQQQQQRTSTKRLTRKISILRKIDHMETEREEMLRRQKVIGRCVERQQIAPQKQIALRRANFAWQKMTNKIGAGKFGSVYTAIRLDTTELIAVKQVKLQNQQDHQAMQSYIDEVTNFESIKHENLVRYYGVEVHRVDELFIFMEFCNEGTLEKLCAEGLSEESVRIYTLHLLKAVCELHRRNICHRDIKPANIFLSSDYTLKLGDFGSSVRLQNSTTNVGELTMHVGTPTYMAPEVCTSSQEGHGRMADIWSVGCVVLEMTTGKPPWHDLRNTWSIIWKVGNGAVPHIPDSISPDCRDFLLKCLKTKSCERSTAEQLLEHPFVKVNF
uniref:Protein kinase domain-containing protein n=1 Tax=Romanomermis culicivorax TaxID=13658 RepID=A0A915K9H4_ROMCU